MPKQLTETMSSPPFPDPENPRLAILMYEVASMLDDGTPVREVVIWAVTHGWMEGYIDAAGEEFRDGEGPVSDFEARRLLAEMKKARGE